MYKTLSIVFLSMFFISCSIQYDGNAKYIQKYELKAVDNYGKDGIKKMRWFIESAALSKEERAYTAYQAAKDCKEKTSAQECSIYQIATTNAYMYGDLFYAILVLDKDEKATTEVSDMELSKNQYNIGFYYTKLKTTYKDVSPVEFQNAFFTIMVNKLKIPENELILPQIKREAFMIEQKHKN